MLIYRFRITCYEHDGFLREIEIQPNQTFLDFHHILLESAELLHCERASFFTADKNYKKNKEISLLAEKRQIRKYDEDLDQVVTESVSLPLMNAEKLKDYIDDPHQKMIYEFAGRDIFAFHVELFKIFPADGLPSFPRCVKRVGELPKKIEQPAVIPVTPVVPKVVPPEKALSKIVDLSKFEDIVEDENELAAIEKGLNGMVEEPGPEPVFDTSETEDSGTTDFLYGEPEEPAEDETLDHIEDYEDIENLDKRLSGFDRDSDDY
ncbi:MAG: hypothetical protein Q8M08_01995 [Bacteroidales bacterium]|nr:hypothetical protein [Bacteroidales bacterium]